MIVHNDPQGSPEWHAARAGCVTASCFAQVLANGKGSAESTERRNLRADIVCEMLSGLPNEPGFQSQDMKNGTAREPLAKADYEIETGMLVTNVGFIRHEEIAAGASLDGRVDEHGAIEVKCPKRATHLDYLRLPPGQCPAIYKPQIMGQMWIAELRWVDFVSWCPSLPAGKLRLVRRRVMRDQAYIDMLTAEIRVFLREADAELAELKRLAE